MGKPKGNLREIISCERIKNKLKNIIRHLLYTLSSFSYNVLNMHRLRFENKSSKPVIVFFMGGFGKGGAETVVKLMIDHLYQDYKCIIVANLQMEMVKSSKFEVICLSDYSTSKYVQYHLIKKYINNIHNLHKIININSISFLLVCLFQRKIPRSVRGKLITNFYSDNVFQIISSKQMLRLINNSNYVLSDNATLFVSLKNYYAMNFDQSKFISLYNPVKFNYHYDSFKKVLSKALENVKTVPTKLLWAARIDKQKNLGLFWEIAKNNPYIVFDVYGEPLLADDLDGFERLKTLDNIIYNGGFSDVTQLINMNHMYSGFIMTSYIEGLPNILLEVGLIGLPVIAPNVGGISELINHTTGYLVENNLASYNNALNIIIKNPELTFKRSMKLRDLIENRHTDEQFSSQLKRIIN